MSNNKVNKPQEENENKRKKGFVGWWNALPNAAKIATSSVAGIGLVSAVVFPTLGATIWKKPNQPKEWYEDEAYISRLDEKDVGTTEKEILVNGQKHKVRLIGINHDDLADDSGKAHTTWEFVNLISDSNGNSLAYLWNDTQYTTNANHYYTNSSIRFALTGSGNNNGNGTTILAGVKGKTDWESEYKNKKIIDMLPSNLINKLKTVKKSVGTKLSFEKTEYTDKLFMLSIREMGYIDDTKDHGYGETYSYYSGHTASKDVIRIKKQVNNAEGSVENIPSGSGHAYSGTVYNYAGFNKKSDDLYGGYYWLRSPTDSYSCNAGSCFNNGNIDESSAYVYYHARGVAPAFCL